MEQGAVRTTDGKVGCCEIINTIVKDVPFSALEHQDKALNHCYMQGIDLEHGWEIDQSSDLVLHPAPCRGWRGIPESRLALGMRLQGTDVDSRILQTSYVVRELLRH